MRKGILIGFTVCVALCLLMGAATSNTSPPKHWQDLLLRLDQSWLNAYGYTTDSVLAYNDWQQNAAIQNANRKILVLEARIMAIESKLDTKTAEDPNVVE